MHVNQVFYIQAGRKFNVYIAAVKSFADTFLHVFADVIENLAALAIEKLVKNWFVIFPKFKFQLRIQLVHLFGHHRAGVKQNVDRILNTPSQNEKQREKSGPEL